MAEHNRFTDLGLPINNIALADQARNIRLIAQKLERFARRTKKDLGEEATMGRRIVQDELQHISTVLDALFARFGRGTEK